MLEKLKRAVCEANKQLPALGLVTLTWGNVSAIDREAGLFAIKPSGVGYDALTPEMIVLCDLEGNVVEGECRPSSDTPTHAVLYQRFAQIGAIVHTHSPEATAWAQARRAIPCYGTTHADCFYGEIPCVRMLTAEELDAGYERNTGVAIAECFAGQGIDPMAVPGVLCSYHGPFTWGKDAAEAVGNALVLERVAELARKTEQLAPRAVPAPQALQDKHYLRKHGPGAYYGQG